MDFTTQLAHRTETWETWEVNPPLYGHDMPEIHVRHIFSADITFAQPLYEESWQALKRANRATVKIRPLLAPWRTRHEEVGLGFIAFQDEHHVFTEFGTLNERCLFIEQMKQELAQLCPTRPTLLR